MCIHFICDKLLHTRGQCRVLAVTAAGENRERQLKSEQHINILRNITAATKPAIKPVFSGAEARLEAGRVATHGRHTKHMLSPCDTVCSESVSAGCHSGRPAPVCVFVCLRGHRALGPAAHAGFGTEGLDRRSVWREASLALRPHMAHAGQWFNSAVNGLCVVRGSEMSRWDELMSDHLVSSIIICNKWYFWSQFFSIIFLNSFSPFVASNPLNEHLE